MKRMLMLVLVVCEYATSQSIAWQDVTAAYTFPAGIKLYHGTRTSPVLSIWYLDADLNDAKLAIRPYIAATSATLPSFTAAVGAYAAINGGFFGGSSSLSAVVYPNEVKASNVQSVTRNGQSYPVVRSFFGMKKDRSLSVDWIYQFGNTMADIYRYPAPLPYAANDPVPQAPPVKAGGTAYADLLVGIGGGPMLIRNDTITVTYNQELMWGSGVGETNGDPRTAVGFTANRHVIMMTADGRQAGSAGVGLVELAQILKGLGCTGAVNLDGGGSTQMAVKNQYINSPSEQRPVPAILAIVSTDSLNLPKEPLFQKVIDTGDSNAAAIGGGWFESANPGYWGATKSQLHSIGTGGSGFEFRPRLPARASYTLSAWWVASSNRSTDTPYIIAHSRGTDTVRVDQTANGSMWKTIGTYEFSGTSSDRVTITDAATTGFYVVADALRFESFDPRVVTGAAAPPTGGVRTFELLQNYPNPFNPSTAIGYTLEKGSMVSMRVYNVLGAEVAALVDGWRAPGMHSVRFDASALPSGMYFYRLRTAEQQRTKPLLLVK